VTQQTDRLNTALAGRYRIERHLGEGGMATVYLCEDMKHDRKVALKLLKPELAAVLGAERFVQEIKTTAALQHPHILPLFDSGSADGFLFYVMPYIQGETLREKLNRETQLGVDEAVRIARDVADALDYAHRHGVIHRDIKPENILMHDGRPMVADFGIALALSAAAGGRMTESGLSLGTPYYMSPEQATAEKEITARSDIYSVGSVLYEMLTGEPPHIGGSAQAIIMKIVTDRARPVTDIRQAVPHHVAAAVAKALEKLPADRFESAKAFADALGNPGYTNATFGGAAASSAGGRAGTSSRPLIATATLAALLLVAALWGWLRPQPAPEVERFDLALGAATPSGDVTISPDGKMIAYAGLGTAGESRIFLRHLDGEPDFRPVAGTEGGLYPDFSPDNQWIVFRRGADGQIAKVTVAGGGATPLTSGADAAYPHWAVQDRVVHSGPPGTFVVSSDGGGTPSPNLRFDGRRPFMLPDGSGVLGVRGGDVVLTGTSSDSAIVLVKNAMQPTYARSGHLLYLSSDGGLFAVPFDLKRHRVTGTPVRVLDNVAYGVGERGYALSEAGTLVHHQGPPASGTGAVATRLVIRRFAGGADTLPLPPGNFILPRVSPNGRFVAYSARSTRATGDFDIYTFDIQTGTNTQITFGATNRQANWSPDGKRLVFDKDSGTGRRIFVKAADNSGAEVRLLEQKGNQFPTAWPREDLILFQSNGVAGGQFDLFTMSPTPGAKPQAYLNAPYDEHALTLSPDGKMAAFVASEAGRPDIWIRDFPTPAGKWKAGPGGNWPRWSSDGRYVYFWRAGTPIDTLFRAQVDRTPAVVVHAPEIVETIDIAGLVNWDLFPDGKRYILAVAAAQASATGAGAPGSPPVSRYVIVKNWFTELKAKTAPKK
jgi:serine/threonine-protein kinase